MKKLMFIFLFFTVLFFSSCNSSDNLTCDYENSDKEYKFKSLDECSVVKFECSENQEYFSDDCGCGCKNS